MNGVATSMFKKNKSTIWPVLMLIGIISCQELKVRKLALPLIFSYHMVLRQNDSVVTQEGL